MHLKINDYLMAVDYPSKFIEVRQVTHKTAEAVISALKQIFLAHEIEKCPHSNNEPILIATN